MDAVKVLDFGLAKLIPDVDRSGQRGSSLLEATSISEEGTVAGTVPYMAPEQIRGEDVDARTDLFALGICMYEMVTARRPFPGQTVADVASAILRDPPVPARAIRLDLPEDLDHVIGRCLEKDPADRYPSAREVGEDRERANRRLDGETEPAVSVPVTSSGSLPSRFSGRPRLLRSRSSRSPIAPATRRTNTFRRARGRAPERAREIPGLRVVGRTSSFQFKGRTKTCASSGGN